MEIFGQLEIVEERYEKLNELLSDPDVVSDTKKLMEYSKEQRSIEKTVAVFREYKDIVQQIKDTKELLEIEEDKEMKEMMQEEIKELEPTLAPMEEELKILLLPKDPNDGKNVVVEVRGAAGGDEAQLFAGDLLRMYTRFAESQGWKVDVLERSETGIGKAMKVLRARVYDKYQQEEQAKFDAERKSKVGTGDRSERIRTYNYPQNRVTDHRIGLTIQKLDQIMEGKLDEVLEALRIAEQAEKMAELNKGEEL